MNPPERSEHPPGRPKGESRSAQHEGLSEHPPGRPKGESRSAQHEGLSEHPPGRPKGGSRSAQHEGLSEHPPGRPKGESRSAQHEGNPGIPGLSRRVRLTILAGAALFLIVLALVASSLIAQGRQAALDNALQDANRIVAGAESSLNRNLLSIDILLAGMAEVLQTSQLILDWIDLEQAARLMRTADYQNLLISHLALMTPDGAVVVSSERIGRHLPLDLPDGFLAEVMAQRVPTLIISAPVISSSSSEPVLYMARTLKLADSSRLVVLAEVRVLLLTAIMSQGVTIPGLEITLERSDGQLLCSVPPAAALTGVRLSPELPVLLAQAGNNFVPGRLSQQPAILVARPTLYSDISISAGVPIVAALANWRDDRALVLTVAAPIALLILAVAALSLRYLGRLGQARMQILEGKAQLEATLDAMPDSLLELGLDGQYYSSHAPHPILLAAAPGLFANGRVSDHLPQNAAQAIMQALHQANETGSSSGTQFELHHGGTQNWFELSVSRRAGGDNASPRFIVISRDITAGKSAAQEIEQLAFFDPLTRLPNRRLLMDRLQHALASSARSGRLGALMFMDLDHFKTINDTLGHDVGDLLLQQVAQRLHACVRETDTVARLGGDEFVVIFEDLDMPAANAAAQIEHIGEKVLAALNRPYEMDQHTLVSTPSIGVTLFNGHEQGLDDLLKQADIAMYQAKTSGRNAIRFYDPVMQAAIAARSSLERDLRTALELEQFMLYYQAQVSEHGHIVGAEVLIRWNHPVRGMVPPMEFIPMAEEAGLILPIGLWVLKTACAQLRAWQTHPRLQEMALAVNVSARQFRAGDFVQQVANVLQQTGANPHRLKLELTESLVLDDVHDTVSKMNQLKTLGVRFSMDDFGTGQSSLSYLTQLPLDQLKIDQSYVRNIGVKSTDAIIIQTIIGLASKLGMEVIAEGVETNAQRAFLLAHGCSIYQGYLLGRPAPLDQFVQAVG
jgi:diguanylate cyclase (GGDEF)-like protein